MAFTEEQLATLERAISEGILTVKYSDKQITYRSLEEMLRIRDLMRDSVNSGQKKKNRVRASFSKGLR